MAISREVAILELAGLRLDQPLAGSGELTPAQAKMASEAKFTLLDRAFRTARDRHIDLIVMHSQILSPDSAAGRAPWFLARLTEGCPCPVVWVEEQVHEWMNRFVDTPNNLIQLGPGETRTVTTNCGPVSVFATSPNRVAVEGSSQEALIGVGPDRHRNLAVCDLWLSELDSPSSHVLEFAPRANESLVRVHTLNPAKADRIESLDLFPVGWCEMDCRSSSYSASGRVADSLIQEVDAAAGRYFADHPQTQLLLVDLKIPCRTPEMRALWSRSQRKALQEELNRLTRHPGCQIRSLTPVRVDQSIDDALAPIIGSIWSTATEPSSGVPQSLQRLVPEAAEMEWARDQYIVRDAPVSTEAQQATLHLLRSAS